jgi:hypothetical protein
MNCETEMQRGIEGWGAVEQRQMWGARFTMRWLAVFSPTRRH